MPDLESSLHKSAFEDYLPGSLISDGIARLLAAGVENPRLDAEAMLAAACRSSRVEVISGLAKIDATAREHYASMLERRIRREPLAYILGHKEFYSLDLVVTPTVLIPRPETEMVVSAALEFLHCNPSATVCDVGTGSGAIALAIAANMPRAGLTATDILEDALAIARHNADRLQLASRIRFRLANCFEPIESADPLGRFDLIVSNPPYIPDAQIAELAPEIRHFEPRISLAGGADGLEYYRRIAQAVPEHLEKNGCIIVEIGADQSDSITEIMRNRGATGIRVNPDLAGLPRVLIAQF